MHIKAVLRVTTPAGQMPVYLKTTADQILVSADVANLFDLPAVETTLDVVLEAVSKMQCGANSGTSAAWLGSSHLGAAFLSTSTTS